MSANNKQRSALSSFLDPLGIFGLQKRAAADEYSQQSTDVSKAQQEMVNRMFAERTKYGAQAEQQLGQAPTYQTPGQISQYQQLMNQYGASLGSQMSGLANQLGRADYTSGGATAMQNAANAYSGSAASLRDIMRSGTQEAANLGATQLQTGLKDTDSFVNYYRQMAGRQEMPGQSAMESKLGRTYAEGYKALGQQGGGSASSLGAMIDLFSNKAESLADIGIQASQYKAQQEAQLGEALQRAQAVRSDLYAQQQQAAMSRAGAMAGAEQTAGTMTATGQEGIANYALNRQGAEQSQALAQAQLINQGITGAANLQGTGLMTGAQYADTAYQYNQLMPWQAGMNYYMQQIAGLNPYGAQSDVYSSQLNTINNLYSLFGKSSLGLPT